MVRIARATFLSTYNGKINGQALERYVDHAFDPVRIKQEILEKQVCYLLVKWTGELIGYVKLRWDQTQERLVSFKALELEKIYLVDEMRGKGIDGRSGGWDTN